MLFEKYRKFYFVLLAIIIMIGLLYLFTYGMTVSSERVIYERELPALERPQRIQDLMDKKQLTREEFEELSSYLNSIQR